ncbi:MAG: hypothetical protein NZZ41_04740 [Candidatus Dojkabacteria bacterium]|nr:hypothetical protein [Candidatus Dojkabacteria bacterium]
MTDSNRNSHPHQLDLHHTQSNTSWDQGHHDSSGSTGTWVGSPFVLFGV